MRKRVEGNGLTVQAVAGNHAVFLAFDLDDQARSGCLGFALEREDHTEREKRWLPGFKTFRSLVPDPDPAKWVTLRDHPLQSFTWGDYSAKPDHDYTYRVVPRYGQPGQLHDQAGLDLSVSISTSDPERGTHGVYFNRGVAASQAYLNRFGKTPTTLPEPKRAEAMGWLSRGLVEALLAFIGNANSPASGLRAAVYEFTYEPVLRAFADAAAAGADVEILYHADGEQGASNLAAIQQAGISNLVRERHPHALAHNKFIVLCDVDGGGLEPVAVWTGSTNITQGGIFGHSNVGHVVRDEDVAARYLALWRELAQNPSIDDLRDHISAQHPFPAPEPQPDIATIFSPRHGLAPLRWYAEGFSRARAITNITCAFGLTTEFEEALQDAVAAGSPTLHFVLLDRADDHQDTWAADTAVFVAVGSSGGPDSLSIWGKESLTGFNHWVPYIHTKVLLVDPLSKDPMVITGSANFSPASTNANDENMLVIRGDRRVADVYFTEFTRIFQHMYARYWAKRLIDTAGADDHSFLIEDDTWSERYFEPSNPKALQRVALATRVEGNE
jgi:PLD-like domain